MLGSGGHKMMPQSLLLSDLHVSLSACRVRLETQRPRLKTASVLFRDTLCVFKREHQ